MRKSILVIAGAGLLLALSAAAGYYYLGHDLDYDSGHEKATTPQVSSFEDCARAGYPIQGSFPEVCRTPDGKSFVND